MGAKGRPPRTEIYHRLDTQISELRNRLGGLPSPAEAADIWKDIWTAEAHHSTALEGNTLVISEVEQLLEEGRAVGAKQLREYMEVKGYANAADWAYREGIQPTSHDPEHASSPCRTFATSTSRSWRWCGTSTRTLTPHRPKGLDRSVNTK